MAKPVTIKDFTAEQLRSGNHEVYEQIFTLWYGPLCYYACSIVHDMDEAEDIVQKMFCKLWDQREKIDIHTSVKSYLYRMVHNSCLNKIQQVKTRAAHHLQYAHTLPGTIENTASRVLHNELEQKILSAIDSLPPQCKKVFEMSRFQQMSYAEIAKTLNVSTNTVENHLSKALKVLRTNLKEFLPALLLFLLKN